MEAIVNPVRIISESRRLIAVGATQQSRARMSASSVSGVPVPLASRSLKAHNGYVDRAANRLEVFERDKMGRSHIPRVRAAVSASVQRFVMRHEAEIASPQP